jgi:3-methyladenine DNA glycosylase AlkC
MSNENPNAFKHFYNLSFLKRLSSAFDELDRRSLLKLEVEFESMEMKDRVRRIRDELRTQLPKDYPAALKIVMKAAKSGKLSNFDYWPLTEFVQTYGTGHPELSLAALRELTKLFTSEFAVRPFLIAHEELTLAYLLRMAKDKNVHLRRWASEGSRPRLPWGQKLHHFIDDPTKTIPILEELKFDKGQYVRKSVANHLNDITKDHPDLVVKLLKRWRKEGDVEWILKHALRSLIKNGHPGALELVGVRSSAKVKLKSFEISAREFKVEDRVDMNLELVSEDSKPQTVVVDYVIYFQKSNGSLSPKVFKLKSLELLPKQTVHLRKSHHLKKVTTRVFYSGPHAIGIQVNGKVVKKLSFHLH